MRHTVVFCALALIVTAASAALRTGWPSLELFVVAAAVVLLGVPHGALDVIHAARTLRVRRLQTWVMFTAAYVAIAAAVVGLWILAPTASLTVFLLISAFHFSGDLEAGTPTILRGLHGASPIVLPALLHGEELAELFAMLIPAAGAEALARTLAAGAPLFLGALLGVLALAALGRLRGATAAPPHAVPTASLIEAAATVLLATLAPPLTAFAIYFCVLHSARHVLRTGAVFDLAPAQLLRASALPTLATAAAIPVAFYALEGATLDARTLQIIFIGLAALTVPHMMLIEPLRLRGWRA